MARVSHETSRVRSCGSTARMFPERSRWRQGPTLVLRAKPLGGLGGKAAAPPGVCGLGFGLWKLGFGVWKPGFVFRKLGFVVRSGVGR